MSSRFPEATWLRLSSLKRHQAPIGNIWSRDRFELDLFLSGKFITCFTKVVAHVELYLSDLAIHFPKLVDAAQIFIYWFGFTELEIFVEIGKTGSDISLLATPQKIINIDN